ncbi:MAG: ABC transporter ATP-binding protein [Bythopirellula sp.]
MNNVIVQLDSVTKTHPAPSGTITALSNVSLEVNQGQFVCIQGHSGSGKSTLLLTVGGMQRPTQGDVVVAGENIYRMSSGPQTRFRADHIGFVFQLFHLLPYLNLLDNVILGGNQSMSTSSKRARASELVEKFGLTNRCQQKPATLSAGERQRVALARALMSEPTIILADEPTGNLDPENSGAVLGSLSEYCQQGGTVLLVTHGDEARQYADRRFVLTQGELSET